MRQSPRRSRHTRSRADAGSDPVVGKSTGLQQLGLERLPRDDLAHAGQPENRIAVMLDQPLAALIVRLPGAMYRVVPTS